MKLQNDKFRRSRGGHSRALEISCTKCGHRLLTYQKDGRGILKRLYLDRIMNPKLSAGKLICKNCHELIGIPIIYKKESRPALRLFAGAVTKKTISFK